MIKLQRKQKRSLHKALKTQAMYVRHAKESARYTRVMPGIVAEQLMKNVESSKHDNARAMFENVMPAIVEEQMSLNADSHH